MAHNKLEINNELYDSLAYFEMDGEYYFKVEDLMNVKSKWAKKFKALADIENRAVDYVSLSDRDLGKIEVKPSSMGPVTTAHSACNFFYNLANEARGKVFTKHLSDTRFLLEEIAHLEVDEVDEDDAAEVGLEDDAAEVSLEEQPVRKVIDLELNKTVHYLTLYKDSPDAPVKVELAALDSLLGKAPQPSHKGHLIAFSNVFEYICNSDSDDKLEVLLALVKRAGITQDDYLDKVCEYFGISDFSIPGSSPEQNIVLKVALLHQVSQLNSQLS